MIPSLQNELGLLTVWWKIALAALGAGFSGSLGVKLVDYAYAEFCRFREKRASSQEIVDKHLDPILKTGEDLVGKLRSLALHDFVDLKYLTEKESHPLEDSVDFELTNVLFLFAQFWSHIQILRREAIYASIGRNHVGASLKGFLDTLESRHVRVLDRPLQRAIGESLICSQGDRFFCMTYFDFLSEYERLRIWFRPLIDVIKGAAKAKKRPEPRQALLRYGSVVHSMLDTLDSKHVLVPDLPGWPNKLTMQTRRNLGFRVFAVRLPLVRNVEKYGETLGQK
jgi:hypothetical protein